LSFADDIARHGQVVDHPSNDVFVSLPWRLFLHPEFQVLKAIIQSLTVLVVNVLPRVKRSAQVLLHHVSMLKDAITTAVKHSVAVPGNRASFVGFSAPKSSGALRGASSSSPLIRRFHEEALTADLALALDLGVSALRRAELVVAGSCGVLDAAVLAASHPLGSEVFPAPPLEVALLRASGPSFGMRRGYLKFLSTLLARLSDFRWVWTHAVSCAEGFISACHRAVDRASACFLSLKFFVASWAEHGISSGSDKPRVSYARKFLNTITLLAMIPTLYVHSGNAERGLIYAI
jgi:hypothetical protein